MCPDPDSEELIVSVDIFVMWSVQFGFRVRMSLPFNRCMVCKNILISFPLTSDP